MRAKCVPPISRAALHIFDRLGARAEKAGYSGGFIEHDITAALYPSGPSRERAA